MCVCVYVCVCTNTKIQPADSMFVVYVFMVSGLTTVHWIINKGKTSPERSILPLPAVISFP